MFLNQVLKHALTTFMRLTQNKTKKLHKINVPQIKYVLKGPTDSICLSSKDESQ